jgi:phosphate:Na+ symporter
MERTLRKSHIARINEKVCFPPSGVIFLDVISNFERIADHATNFAQVVLGEV